MLKKKIWANSQRIIDDFTQKMFTMLSNTWVWDPGSGKNLFRIPDLGVKKAPDPGSGSATLVSRTIKQITYQPVLRIRIRRIRTFLGLLDPDPDPLVRGMDPDPSIIMQK
jgi:hypothetical protein